MKLGLSARLARTLILASQRTRFRGVGGYSPEAFAKRGSAAAFPQATRESSLYEDFFQFFRGRFDVEAAIRGRDVLDFGSGYGGRTVDYARRGGARHVWGVEPVESHITLAEQYAASLGVHNVGFKVCGATTVPLPDASVDVVLSFDVLEHVQSPPASVAEILRVLRPGGYAIIVFPVYQGMRAHHLDYVTTLPGVHWVFSAPTLVDAVNSILREDEGMVRFGTKLQPEPTASYTGEELVLPHLNGLRGRHLPQLFSAFEVLDVHRHLVGRSRPSLHRVTRFFTRDWAPMAWRDAVTDSVSLVLRKPLR